MSEFFTWQTLATYAGATAATAVFTQLFKGLGFIAKIPTQIFSYIIALVILVAATLASPGWAWADLALCLLNAAVVSLASNGAYEAMRRENTEK